MQESPASPSPNAASATTAAAAAPSASSSATPDERATSFQAVQGGGEQVNGGTLLISEYAVVWCFVLLVVLRVYRKQTKTSEQIASLERAIEKAGKKA